MLERMSEEGFPELGCLANHPLGRDFIGLSIVAVPSSQRCCLEMLERMSEKGFPGLRGLANYVLGRDFIGLSIVAVPSSQKCCLECWRG